MLELEMAQQAELQEIEYSPFSPLSLFGEDARYMGDEEMGQAYGKAINDIVEGRNPAMFKAVDKIVRDHHLPIIDQITAEIGYHIGIDVVAALALAVILDKHSEIQNADQDLVFLISAWEPSDVLNPVNCTWLAPKIRWTPRGVIIALPETLATASIGRPLSQIVSHPVLDRHPLTITGVSMESYSRIILEVDADRKPISAEALIAMRPAIKAQS